MQQKYPHWELIIVNDGSTDNSGVQAEQLVREVGGTRVTIIHQENRGLADARNTGITAAHGSWIVPLDSDDALDPTFLLAAVAAIEHNPSLNHVTCFGKEFGARTGIREYPDYSEAALLTANCFPCTCLYAKDLFTQVGGYDPHLPWGLEDWAFWLACSREGLRTHKITAPLFLHRVRDSGSMLTTLALHNVVSEAMLMTLFPSLYPHDRIIACHHYIEQMDGETMIRLQRKIVLFPERSPAYFWLGLFYLAQHRYEEALQLFLRAQQYLSTLGWQPLSWQPLWGEIRVHAATGDQEALTLALSSFIAQYPDVAASVINESLL